VADVDGDAARAVADEVDGVAVVADVSDSAQVDAAFAACIEAFGGIDLAHLNAGIMGNGDVSTLTDEEYDRFRGVNLDGVVYGVRATVRAIQGRTDGREGGVIVAMASLAGIEPHLPNPIYTLTKHAVVGFIRSLGPTLAKEGITAHAICPGLVDTPMPPEQTKAAFTAMGLTLVTPEQVADAVVVAATAGPELSGTCWVVQSDAMAPHYFHDVPGPHKVVMQAR
jgi:NAD(P)-dependent dehydrogenase (short-subunit alcohol dehydrogenase family)